MKYGYLLGFSYTSPLSSLKMYFQLKVWALKLIWAMSNSLLTTIQITSELMKQYTTNVRCYQFQKQYIMIQQVKSLWKINMFCIFLKSKIKVLIVKYWVVTSLVTVDRPLTKPFWLVEINTEYRTRDSNILSKEELAEIVQ